MRWSSRQGDGLAQTELTGARGVHHVCGRELEPPDQIVQLGERTLLPDRVAAKHTCPGSCNGFPAHHSLGGQCFSSRCEPCIRFDLPLRDHCAPTRNAANGVRRDRPSACVMPDCEHRPEHRVGPRHTDGSIPMARNACRYIGIRLGQQPSHPGNRGPAAPGQLEPGGGRREAHQRPLERPLAGRQPPGALWRRGQQCRHRLADHDRSPLDGHRGYRLGHRMVRPGAGRQDLSQPRRAPRPEDADGEDQGPARFGRSDLRRHRPL